MAHGGPIQEDLMDKVNLCLRFRFAIISFPLIIFKVATYEKWEIIPSCNFT